MRSSVPVPGNPWPHDMVITVEDDPHALVELLWIREAWNLRPVGDDLPPSLADGSVRAYARIDVSDRVATWQEAWPSMWEAGVHHAGLLRDGAMFDRLPDTADGALERARLSYALRGPSWDDKFGREALTDRYQAWNVTRFDARSRRRRSSLDEEPERVSLAALIPAWESGLHQIVTIPCLGSYTRVIGRNSLLVTEETREDPGRYSEALRQFR